MLTALDFLTLAFIGLFALSLLAVCLMFLARKPVARKVCFYIVVILCIYMAYVGLYISSGFFLRQTIRRSFQSAPSSNARRVPNRTWDRA